MDIFLRAKHWQIFLVMFVLPFILQVLVFLPITIATEAPGPILLAFPVAMILSMSTFFGWFWTVGIRLHALLPPGAPMPLRRFKAFIIFPIAYILFLTSGISLVPMFMTSAGDPSAASIFSAMAIILPLHFFSMFCMFHSLWFIARMLKSIEFQREVDFEGYAGEFFLLWFLPIGIWFIQPRINRLASTQLTRHLT